MRSGGTQAPAEASPIDRTDLSPADTAFFGHPRGLSTLFFTELWERFSYYGMRAILILFMTAPVLAGGLGFPAAKAGLIYGTYTAMVYLMSLPGGWLADRFLGLRRAVFVGGVIIMAGHVCLAIPSIATFYLGLALVVMGTGLLKPTISATVGELYSPGDARRDAGFSIYYMGINLGAFMAPLVVGWLAQGEAFRSFLEGLGISARHSWHFGFAAAAVGMLAGLIWYRLGSPGLGEAGLHPTPPSSPAAAERDRRLLTFGGGGILTAAAAFAALAALGVISPTAEGVSTVFGYVLALIPFVLFPGLYFFGGFDAAEKKKLLLIMALFFGASIFWSIFEQAGSTLNLFADRDTHTVVTPGLAAVLSLILLVPAGLCLRWYQGIQARTPLATGFLAIVVLACAGGIAALFANLGDPFPSSFFQSANALFIVALAPLFASLWSSLGSRQPSSPLKFALGLLFAGLGFVALLIAARLAAQGVKVSPLWLTAAYLLHTLGELALSPVGLSAMSTLAPRRIVGLTLGIWFLATAVGNFFAGFAGSLYEKMPLPTLFGTIAGIAFLATLVMGALTLLGKRSDSGRAGI